MYFIFDETERISSNTPIITKGIENIGIKYEGDNPLINIYIKQEIKVINTKINPAPLGTGAMCKLLLLGISKKSLEKFYSLVEPSESDLKK